MTLCTVCADRDVVGDWKFCAICASQFDRTIEFSAEDAVVWAAERARKCEGDRWRNAVHETSAGKGVKP